MALIGLVTATVLLTIAFIRCSSLINKTFVTLAWGVAVVYSFGWFL